MHDEQVADIYPDLLVTWPLDQLPNYVSKLLSVEWHFPALSSHPRSWPNVTTESL
jgi:hypothetical protein